MVKKGFIFLFVGAIVFLTLLGWYSRNQEKKAMHVGLTFNIEEGNNTEIQEIIELLKIYNQKGTIFIPGNWFAETELTGKENLDALRNGIISQHLEIGSFTGSIPNMSSLSEEKQYEEIQIGKKQIEQNLNTVPKVFRPPYFDYNTSTIAASERANQTFLLADIDTQDWKEEKPIHETIKHIKENLFHNSVIIFRTNKQTIAILKELLPYMQAENIQSLQISEMIPLEKERTIFHYKKHPLSQWDISADENNALSIVKQDYGIDIEYFINDDYLSSAKYDIPYIFRDWSDYEHVQFQVIGEDSGNTIKIHILDADDEVWEYDLPDTFLGNRNIAISLKEFISTRDDDASIFDYNFAKAIYFRPGEGEGKINIKAIILQ